jgi:hypothetical protein
MTDTRSDSVTEELVQRLVYAIYNTDGLYLSPADTEHIARLVIDELRGAAQTGRNRDPIFAPDGKTWYQTALDEAAKRGENELRIHELEAELSAHPTQGGDKGE